MRSLQAIRVESRNLLKFLIALNLLFFTYQLIVYDSGNIKSTVPCIVVVNQSQVIIIIAIFVLLSVFLRF